MPLCYYNIIHCPASYLHVSQHLHGTIDREFWLTLLLHILRIVLLVILPSLLKHLVNAALFQSTLLNVRLSRL